MAVYKVFPDGNLILLKFPSSAEEHEFLEKNKFQGYEYISDDELPDYEFEECLKFDKNTNKIVVDRNCELEKRKMELINEINRQANQYIWNFLKAQGWGETYSEALAELNNSIVSTETHILYILSKYTTKYTLTDIREYIAKYLAGVLTNKDVLNELNKIEGVTEDDKALLLDLLVEAAKIANILNWKDNCVWKYVEKIEDIIRKTTELDMLHIITREEKERGEKGIEFDLAGHCPYPVK